MNIKKIVGVLFLVFLIACKHDGNNSKDKLKQKTDEFIVTVKDVENGTITCTKDGSVFTDFTAVPKEANLKFILKANDGYKAKSLKLDITEYTTLKADGTIEGSIVVTKNIEVYGECIQDPDKSLRDEITELLKGEMVLVPIPEGGLNVPLGFDDVGNDIDGDGMIMGGGTNYFVNKPFSIAKHEVSYKLFYDVRIWAERNGYKFANKGLAGSEKGSWNETEKIWLNEGKEPTEETKNLPATMISYNDLVVWCNALSELMGKEAVYYKESSFKTILKDAGERAVNSSYVLKGEALDCHNAKAKPTADGYRLPREKEWELAAKWQGTEDKGNSKSLTSNSGIYYFTKGDSLSGASSNFRDEQACNKVAWYKKNSGNKAHVIGEKSEGANALGLFDMSGNVAEFTASRKAGGHTLKGGSFNNVLADCITTYKIETKPEEKWDVVGFRLCSGVQGELLSNHEPNDIDALINFPSFTGEIKIPTAIDDSDSEKIKATFKIGKYEVCNKLFIEVLDWANENGYTFAYEKKTIAKEDELKPVANVTWYDVVVWCNAYSEKKNLTPCYYDKTKVNILKSSKEDKWNEIFEVSIKEGSTGYRLPSIYEWIAVARLREDNVNAVEGKSFTSTDGKTYYFTKGNAVSGAFLNYDDEIERDLYSINRYNSDFSTAIIGSKKPNFLGVFDMSGNVWEWCFEHESDSTERYCANMGGGFVGEKFYQLSIGNVEPTDIFNAPQTKNKDLGFRVVQN